MNTARENENSDRLGSISVPITSVRDLKTTDRCLDYVAVEEPLQIVITENSAEILDYAAIMRTPTMDYFLGLGFLYSEGIIKSMQDIDSVEGPIECPTVNNRIIFHLKNSLRKVDLRERYVNSSCGVCGKGNIDEIFTRVGKINRSGIRISADFIGNMPKALLDRQSIFKKTGGIHAAGIFDIKGELLFVAEDVGRHNAVDKIVGYLLHTVHIPAEDIILQVSGRAGFEIVQKAALAHIPIVSSVSAPSSLSVEAAESMGITLICFVRGKNFNIYTHPERVILG